MHTLAAIYIAEWEFVEQENGEVLWLRVKSWLCLLH
jgi:hypothetical protein